MIKIFSILIHFNPTYKITGTWIMSFGTCILFFQKKKEDRTCILFYNVRFRQFDLYLLIFLILFISKIYY